MIHADHANNVVIQQGGTGNMQSAEILDRSGVRGDLHDLIALIREQIDAGNTEGLSGDPQDVLVDVDTVERELTKKSPNRGILESVLNGLRDALKSITSDWATKAATEMIPQIIFQLSTLVS